jgi:hypothetical protein
MENPLEKCLLRPGSTDSECVDFAGPAHSGGTTMRGGYAVPLLFIAAEKRFERTVKSMYNDGGAKDIKDTYGRNVREHIFNRAIHGGVSGQEQKELIDFDTKVLAKLEGPRIELSYAFMEKGMKGGRRNRRSTRRSQRRSRSRKTRRSRA